SAEGAHIENEVWDIPPPSYNEVGGNVVSRDSLDYGNVSVEHPGMDTKARVEGVLLSFKRTDILLTFTRGRSSKHSHKREEQANLILPRTCPSHTALHPRPRLRSQTAISSQPKRPPRAPGNTGRAQDKSPSECRYTGYREQRGYPAVYCAGKGPARGA